jgi:hypothetical protein
MSIKRVLLIGNGHTLLEYDYGNIIDSNYFDEVWRFNRFITDGYEEHTGTKTDVWVSCFGGQSMRDLTTMNLKKLVAGGWGFEDKIKNNEVDDYYKVYLDYIKMIKDNNLKTKVDYIPNKIWDMLIDEKSDWYLDRTKIYCADNVKTFYNWINRKIAKDFDKEKGALPEYSLPTTGLATIIVNIVKGNEVWLHGHDLFKQQSLGYEVNTCYHYYEDRVYATSHDHNKEREYTKNLINNKKVFWLNDNLDKINER